MLRLKGQRAACMWTVGWCTGRKLQGAWLADSGRQAMNS